MDTHVYLPPWEVCRGLNKRDTFLSDWPAVLSSTRIWFPLVTGPLGPTHDTLSGRVPPSTSTMHVRE